jgi:hypothetical protein
MITIVQWTPCRRGASLRGFVDIELPSGLLIADVAVHVVETNGRGWASPPARPVLDREGHHKRGENGKGVWQPLISFRSRDIADRFSRAVLDALAAAHPEAVEGWQP